MAAAVVTIVVDQFLQELDRNVFGVQWGLEHEFGGIFDLVSSVRHKLMGAENKCGLSLELLDWLGKFKDVIFDAEDLLEEFSAEASRRQQLNGEIRGCLLFRAVDKLVFGLKMHRKFRALSKRLVHVTEKDPSDFTRALPTDNVGEGWILPSFRLFGRKRDKEQLISFLLEARTRPPVLTVVGEAGIGKTALVRDVYLDKTVGRHFDFKIWVNASPPFNEKRMARDIVASLKNHELEEEDPVMEQLLHQLKRTVDGKKKYLFVLDDLSVEDPRRWLHFRRILLGGARGSKVLVTARADKNISTSTNFRAFIVQPLPLSDSLTLLSRAASEGRKETMNSTELYSAESSLASACKGIPSLLMTFGGYLSSKHDIVDWLRFRDRLLEQDNYGLVWSLLCGGYPYAHSIFLLKQRYDFLHSRIKRCFGFCSLFPRGHVVDRQTLVTLWIALGYIQSSSGVYQSLEDTADNYLQLLLQQNFFRVETTDICENVRSVVLHDGAADLAHSIAGWECVTDFDPFIKLKYIAKARHASVAQGASSLLNPGVLNLQKLRTILFFVNPEGYVCDNFVYHLKRVRVLDLHLVNLPVLPNCIWKLKHLTFLDLSDNNKIETLPSAITRMLNLCTLKLSRCSELKQLPQDIRNMAALRHLYVDGCWKLSCMPQGLSDLKLLSILTDFILPMDDCSSVNSADLSELYHLNKLRGRLKIINLGYAEDEQEKSEVLTYTSSLESLDLRFGNLVTDELPLQRLKPHLNLKALEIHNYGGIQFPEWMLQLTLPKLVEIALVGCERIVQLPLLHHLPNLKSVRIEGLPDLEHMQAAPYRDMVRKPIVAYGMGPPFRRLSTLCIKDCPKLKSVPELPHLVKLNLVNVSIELFDFCYGLGRLKFLHLENIELLDRLPENWLRELTSLQELHIGSCPGLISLSQGIRHLVNLKSLSFWTCRELDLSRDEYGAILELGGITKLESLTIYKAPKMRFLPEWLSHAATLRYLSIRSCPSLEALPEWMKKLSSLTGLELAHCPRLSSLPGGIRRFADYHLRELNIVGCPLLDEENSRGIDRVSYKL